MKTIIRLLCQYPLTHCTWIGSPRSRCPQGKTRKPRGPSACEGACVGVCACVTYVEQVLRQLTCTPVHTHASPVAHTLSGTSELPVLTVNVEEISVNFLFGVNELDYYMK